MAFLQETHIETADIQHFVKELGYEHIDAWEKKLVGRRSLKEVVLLDRLRASLMKLNAHLPNACLDTAVAEITKSRASLSPIMANKEIYELLKNGVAVSFKNAAGREVQDYVRIIDFADAENNDFVVVSQLSIEYLQTQNITRRPDLLLYVNGLPLVMIELKNAREKVKSGFDKNLTAYQRDIPQLFWFNLFVCISNGIQTRVGSFNSPWDHFFTWLKLTDTSITHEQATQAEIEAESTATGEHLSLKLFGTGLCSKANLIDYFENFVLFHKNKTKIIAKNHQYLGVNNAILGLQNKDNNQGKLGVFWHTQGSGKSYSMIFFSEKIRRKVIGNWSFLILTDRKDLDSQIYRNFLETETIVETKDQKENYFRPENRTKLQEYLQSNRTYLFTLIHKFGIESGKTFPLLTDRNDWIVIVDEAHRTQYNTLAENMRIALPNAQYIAFTGTPLLRNEQTNDKFGGYVSEYNFAQSIEDGATVPIYYKKSVPTVVNENPDLITQAVAILDDENLSDKQREKLDKEYSTILNIVRRDDRLEEIAKHIVQHFPYRLDVVDDKGNNRPMKAMVISIDKFTAVRMYEKVERLIVEEKKELRRKINAEKNSELKAQLQRAWTFLDETKMAVVISQEGSDKDEEKTFDAANLNIRKHRDLMDKTDDGLNIEDYFKNVTNNYRIVFVTAMWMTGFDAPSVSTLYLDKPLQNHTLMQTIARANRVLEGKKNGLVVDYFGVFRNLKIALAAYAEGTKGKIINEESEFPVKEFEELVALLEQAITEAKAYCNIVGADLDTILNLGEKGFKEIELFQDYANLILKKDEYKEKLGLFVNTIVSLYDSAKPEIYAYPDLKKNRDVLQYLRDVVDRNTDKDEAIEHAKGKLNQLLDDSILGEGNLAEPQMTYKIDETKQIDLSKLNFEQLRDEFPEKKHKNIQFADLRELLELKLKQMLAQNKTRGSFLADFQKVIDDYNAGSLSIEEAYEQLLRQTAALSEEQHRAAKNDMTEQEQELFDLLKKEKLTKEEEKSVKLAAKTLLQILFDAKNKIFIQEWHKEKASQEKVKHEIQNILNTHLPNAAYDRVVFSEKVNVAYAHFYEMAQYGMAIAA
jgi:type I restriction enzyme, R subunit